MSAISTKELSGLTVVDGRNQKRIGKVRYFIFHPDEVRLVGFTVKRSDRLLMFKRKDLFVQLGGFDVEGGSLVVRDDTAATGAEACKALGVDWDRCVLWIGMPAMTEEGDVVGYIDDALFDPFTGQVDSLSIATGKTKDALLGRRMVRAEHIAGFRRGQGIALAPMGEYDGSEDALNTQRGAIIVDAACLSETRKGGIAEAAGKASAVVTDKARRGVATAKKQAENAYNQAKPEAKKAAATAGEAINQGAYAAGEHVAKLGGMFSAFKDEFVKGMNGEYADEDD